MTSANGVADWLAAPCLVVDCPLPVFHSEAFADCPPICRWHQQEVADGKDVYAPYGLKLTARLVLGLRESAE